MVTVAVISRKVTVIDLKSCVFYSEEKYLSEGLSANFCISYRCGDMILLNYTLLHISLAF